MVVGGSDDVKLQTTRVEGNGDAEKRSTDNRCSEESSEWSWLWAFGCWLAVERCLTDQFEQESRLERRFVMFRMMNCEKTKHEELQRVSVLQSSLMGTELGVGDDGINHPSEGVGRAL